MSLKASRKQGTLEARLESLLLSSQFSDCSFLVGDNEKTEIFFAHRVLLASCSPVFEAMFFGPLAETQQVCVPDIDQNGFRLLLQYVYTCQAKFVNLKEACSVFYAAKKYLITDLADLCKAYITQEMNLESAATVYELSQTFQDKELYEACLKEMRKNPSRIILGSETQHVSPDLVVDLLSADILNATEYTLFQAVLLWTIKECHRRGILPNGTSYRMVLEECGIWPLLRPLTLRTCQFSVLEHTGLFSPEEVDCLKAYFSKRDLGESRYNEEDLPLPRTINSTLRARWPTRIRPQICERRRLKPGPPSGGPFKKSVTITVDTSVQLRAIRIPSRLCPAALAANKYSQMYEEALKLVITDRTGLVVARRTYAGQVSYNTDMTIELQEPLLLQENQPYCVSVLIDSRNAEYPSYRLSVGERVKDVMFSFDDDVFGLSPVSRPSIPWLTFGFITGLTFTL